MKGTILLIVVAAIGIYALTRSNNVDEKKAYLKNYYANKPEFLRLIDLFTPDEIIVIHQYVIDYVSKGIDVAEESNLGKQLSAMAAKYNFS